MVSNHDIVTVIFQEKPEVLPSMPKLLDVCIQQLEQSNKLPCQELRPCNRGKKELVLPEKNPNLPRVNRDIAALSFVLNAVRSDQDLSDSDALIPVWARCWSLLSDKAFSIWQVGFLPYLPYGVTKYYTVFTALYNLANATHQLQQHCLPVFCD